MKVGSNKSNKKSPNSKDSNLYEDLLSLTGIGPKKVEELIAAGIKSLDDIKSTKFSYMVPEETVLDVKFELYKEFTRDDITPFVRKLPDELVPVGGYRRKKPKMKDLDLLTCMELQTAAELVENLPGVKIMHKYRLGNKVSSMVVNNDGVVFKVDIFKTTNISYPFALLHFTGDKIFNIKNRKLAKKKGYHLNEKGIWKAKESKYYFLADAIKGLNNEKDILAFLGVEYKEPPERSYLALGIK